MNVFDLLDVELFFKTMADGLCELCSKHMLAEEGGPLGAQALLYVEEAAAEVTDDVKVDMSRCRSLTLRSSWVLIRWGLWRRLLHSEEAATGVLTDVLGHLTVVDYVQRWIEHSWEESRQAVVNFVREVRLLALIVILLGLAIWLDHQEELG